jgi:hypothetical protein
MVYAMRRMVRRSIALAAAYALALQAALALPVGVPLAPDAGFVICRGDDSGAPSAPAHEKCDFCLAGHCAGASGKNERVAFAAPWLRAIGVAVAPSRIVRLTPLASVLAPHAPRAPPRG